MQHRSVVATVVAAGLLTVGCGGGSTSHSTTPSTIPPDQAGAPAISVLTIKMGNVNEASASEGAILREFAKQVDERSGGNLAVTFKWDLDGTSNALTHPTAEAVEKGTVDMAAEWAGAWGTQGVTTLRATQTPFLIRSFAQSDAMLRDDPLVKGMLAGLDKAGVVGLTLFPVDIRPMIDFVHPIQGPADLRHQVFRSPWSNETYPALEALGAQPKNYPPKPDARDFSPGNQSSLPKGWVVGNWPLGFRYYTIVANGAFWSKLTSDQQQVLQQAAAAAQQLALSTKTEKAAQDEMAKYCAGGGTITELPQSGIEAFMAAVAPAVSTLKADATNAAAIDRIDQLGQGVQPTVFPACGGDTTSKGADAAAFPEGVYRFEVTDADLKRVETDPANWADDRGIYTYTLKGGKFSYTQQTGASTSPTPVGGGTYVVDGNFVTFTEPAGPNNEPNPTVMTWELGADKSLHFKIITANFNYVQFIYGEPWLRIGDAP
jgi:TRAP-type C4-dicarboxylate transport system substrate-binding protein